MLPKDGSNGIGYYKLPPEFLEVDTCCTESGCIVDLPLPLEARKSARAEVEIEVEVEVEVELEVEVNIAAMMLSHLLQRAT